MTALFAAEIQISRNHFFDHVTIAHFRANDFAAACSKRFVETEVAHDRCDQRVVAELIRFQKVERGDRENLVAIDDLAIFIAKKDAIGIAVVSDSDISAA